MFLETFHPYGVVFQKTTVLCAQKTTVLCTGKYFASFCIAKLPMVF
ncbi:MAG: hypothetical protein JETT_0816 [Candidatus Jettenia ecosi]|uniref:Uncharacterized protein n=1 Tax=Candidatus Jettenia ecosi TaxID=2494326 RepID=A0A533QDT8_9BACT|nr:MAG: hypothetical protein JETT_0816 [Candidatus Jettenia ecosi]